MANGLDYNENDIYCVVVGTNLINNLCEIARFNLGRWIELNPEEKRDAVAVLAELCGFVVHNEELDFMGPSFINSNEELIIVGSSFISFHLRYGENSNINALFSALSRCGILLTVVCPDTLMTVVRHDALMTVVRHDTLRTVPSDHVQFRDGETQTRASHRTVHDPKDYLAPGIGSCSNNSIVISKPKMTLHDYQVKNGQGEDQIGEQGPFGIFSRLVRDPLRNNIYLGSRKCLCEKICCIVAGLNIFYLDLMSLYKFSNVFKELWRYMFCPVALDVSFFHLTDTCCVVFID
ncbi:hypothetical protein LXL04_006482 [Taraxacum kok-saghyz]